MCPHTITIVGVTMVKIYYKNLRTNRFQTLKNFKKGSWIHVEDPTDEEITQLVADFELEEGHLRDAEDFHEVPRLEVEESVVYIFTRFPFTEKSQVLTAPILFVLGDGFLLTLTDRDFPQLDKFLNGKLQFFTTQKAKLLLQLFMQINISYNTHLNMISRRIRSVGLQLEVERISNRDIIQFVKFENILNDFISALIPTNNILQSLLYSKHISLYEEDKDIVEDLLLSNGQLIESIKSNLRTIVNIRESFSTIMTNNLNQVVKLLTAMTIIFTIPTMIASLFGMNVSIPLGQNPHAFAGIVTVIILASLSTLYLFYKKRWL